MGRETLTRREALRLGGLGLLATLIANCAPARAVDTLTSIPTLSPTADFKYQATVGDGVPPTPGLLEPVVSATPPTEVKPTATSTKAPEPTTSSTKPPEPTATNTKPPEPTVTAIKPPEATKTPEGPKFGKWDVFAGQFENGEPLMVFTLSNGQVVLASNAKKPVCGGTQGQIRIRITAAGNVQADSFDFQSGPAKIGISGKLAENQVSGSIAVKASQLITPAGTYTCPAETVSYIVSKTGTGRNKVFETYRKVFSETGAKATDKEITDFFEKFGQIKIPTE